MTTVTEAQAGAAYAERRLLERSARAAAKLCQWQIAVAHYESAMALLPADPHKGEHPDAARYRRQIRIHQALVGTSTGMRPTKDNPEYRKEEIEHNKRVEEYRNTFWSPE